jgi:hypothetical protein
MQRDRLQLLQQRLPPALVPGFLEAALGLQRLLGNARLLQQLPAASVQRRGLACELRLAVYGRIDASVLSREASSSDAELLVKLLAGMEARAALSLLHTSELVTRHHRRRLANFCLVFL